MTTFKLTGGEMTDIISPDSVEVKISDDRSTLWVNVDGVCVLRVQTAPGEIALDVRLEVPVSPSPL